ncbi:MAG: choline-sulfatase [Flavobacteriaceae bacterium]|nr:choline-sulfatase [Flavobacteriaceae bacterium]
MRYFFIFCLSLFVISCNHKTEKTDQKNLPNILFLFADDYTFDAIHALGNDVIETPNLDQLVRNGSYFSQAFNMGGWNGAVCIASRSMIITGQSIWDAKAMTDDWKQNKRLNQASLSWGKLMEQKGYQTYMTGKWHVSIDPQMIFQTVRNIRPGMPKDYWNTEDKKGYDRPKEGKKDTWIASDSLNEGFWEGGKHWSEVIKDDALDFLKISSQKEAPFFMYLAFNAPHDPRQSPQSFLDRYPLEKIPLPENWLPEYPFKDAIGNSKTLRDEALAPYPRTPYAIKTHMREYFAIITHLDEQIGKILHALEASGRADNTYIFFTGDHGLSVGKHGLLGKQSLFDHSIRVPLIFTGPEIPKNQIINHEVYLQDIMATSLELAEIPKPKSVAFKSFLSLIKGNEISSPYPEGIYGAYMDYQRMIRKDGYKLMVYPKIKKLLLFDLKNDPLEQQDISNKEEYKNTVKNLFESLILLQRKYNDNLDLNNFLSY